MSSEREEESRRLCSKELFPSLVSSVGLSPPKGRYVNMYAAYICSVQYPARSWFLRHSDRNEGQADQSKHSVCDF